MMVKRTASWNRVRSCTCGLAIVALIASIAGAYPASAGQIQWRSGPVLTEAQDRAELAAAVSEAVATGQARHMVVQFDRPIGPEAVAELARAGVTILGYVGDNAFFAAVAPERADAVAVAAVPALATVLPVERDWKLHPMLAADQVPLWAVVDPRDKAGEPIPDPIVGAYILFHKDVPLVPDGVNLARSYGGVVRDTLHSINGLVIELPYSQIKPLAEADPVSWIEPPLPRMSEVNDSNRARVGADTLQAPPYGLDGSGVTVLVYDGGTARASHVDFQGRCTVHDSSGQHYHSTHVAGTIGGAGVANPAYKGMAPGVTIVSYGFEYDGSGTFLYSNPGDIESDYSEAINTYGAQIANNSIGTNTESNGFDCAIQGNYGVTSQLIDTIVRGDGSNPLFAAPFRIVWANGNERQGSRCDVEGYGDYYSTAPPAGAKNHLAIGALNSNDDSMTTFSSWGPTDDGRLKPDFSAPGCQSDADGGVTSCTSTSDTAYTTLCGTSMASPTVCGISALLLQDFQAQFPGEPDPRNSTLKVLLGQTAVDIGNPGPDYMYGYGSVRIQPAVDLMRAGNFLEDEVVQGETFSVLVVAGPSDSELKVTLAWDDYPGTPNVDPALVNDLDLRVFDSSNTRYYPWTLDPFNPSGNAVQTQEDHLNNIEQVFINAPAPGAYRIEVHGFNVPNGPQAFSLAASPLLVACSPQGVISLDRAKYQCESTATIQVVDCDLNTDDGAIETVTVMIESDSEPTGESVLLTETAAETAAFRGMIDLSQTDGAGILLIAAADAVTATYIDADDGQGGTNVVVTADAVVDCDPPIISNIQVTNIEPRSATISFDTNELANGTLSYGTSCGSLTEVLVASGFRTDHSFNLLGLTDDTTYFYAVEAVDEAGNSDIDDNGGNCYAFSTPQVPDFYTEEFVSDNDLDNISLFFTPNASVDFYDGCAEAITELPTDPAGGTAISLTDDSYGTVNLTGGASVSLYGTSYTTIYPGSNGYVTFTAGDSDYSESLADHFDTPRVSGLFDDLDPAQSGTVSWKQLADRVAVTWNGVTEHNSGNSNTFQIELYFDGRITISYLSVVAADGVAGLSEGQGIDPDFLETDLTNLGACGPQPPVANSVSVNTAVSMPVTITLPSNDDGLPDPPAAVTTIVTSLPAHGDLSDPGAGAITGVPYTLVGNGNQVAYQPDLDYDSGDSFQFMANDGGVPPEGGDSNTAVVTITMGGPAWDPVAYDMDVAAGINLPTDITLSATDPNGDPLTYYIESLPALGSLSDPGAGAIGTVPYELVGGGKVVHYVPPVNQAPVETFDFSAQDATAGSNVATVTVTVGAPQVAHDFPMDSNPGWSTEGSWAFGQPTGGGSGNHDPTSGHTGSNVYGYNLNGDYANSMPVRYLTTTAIDCSNLTGVELRFWRWLGVESSYFDHANVQVSNNGSDWTTLWQNGTATINESSWSQRVYDISAVADEESTVYLRWTMGPTDGSGTYAGWNIDDLEIWAVVWGGEASCTNGIQDPGEDRIDCGGPCPPCDCTSDGECDNATYCDGAETCDAYGTCQAGTPVDCPDDGLYCNGTEFCDEVDDVCDSTGDPCVDDGLYCNGDEFCDEVGDVCDSTGDPCVDDGLYCNGTEFCDEGGDVCDSTGDPCVDDGLYCNGTEFCDEGGDVCDSTGDPCVDDGLYCNGTEFCDEGADVCDSTGDPCTDDGLYCNGTEFCDEGADACDSTGDPCTDDGLYCNGTEFCDEDADVCDSTGDPCVLPEVCDEDADMCVLESTTISGAACCLDQGGTEYCLDLVIGGPATVEPRLGSVTTLVVDTVDPVEAGSTTATATCVNQAYGGTVTVTSDGTTTVLVDLDPLPDGDCCTIEFDGGIVDSIGVRLLAGDVNGDGTLSTADASSIKQRLGIVIGASDFWYDVNMDGSVSTADGSSIKQRLGNFAPTCP
ncbi:MAG TPA: S8 family serine peptidase [Phycisphaerae bacterium]|nr:S8 family serine peptidase [Phycisphaerae bacterium]